jgi:transposase
MSGHIQPLSLQVDGTSGHVWPHEATLRECLLSSRSRVRVAVGAQFRGLEPQRTEWLGAKLGAKVSGSCHVRDESPAPWVRRGRDLLGRREEPVHGCGLDRLRAVLEVLDGIPVTEVAGRFGVARQTVHRWVSRYRDRGIDGLADRSHAPRAHRWRISAEVEAVICDLRSSHRQWGPRRLVFELAKRGHPDVSRSTVCRVLVRHQLLEPVSRRRRRDTYRRWERPAAMELWQMDVTASLFLAGGRECKVITGIDGHSRFCVIAAVVMRATARALCLAFTAAMTGYGIPGEVLTGNGRQFTGRFGRPRRPRCCSSESAGRTASPSG